MAKHNNTITDSPQKSLLGNIPTKKGGDMAIQSSPHQLYVDDEMTSAPIGMTNYIDIPFGRKNVLSDSPQKSDITKKGK